MIFLNFCVLKELVQNAEDAGATEVSILYDGRPINTEINDKTMSYRKFFKVRKVALSISTPWIWGYSNKPGVCPSVPPSVYLSVHL